MKLAKTRKRNLKLKVGGSTVRIPTKEQDEDVQFLEHLERELGLFFDVFKCLSKVDKSLHPDCEKEIIIHLQCSPICLSRKFCEKVIRAMGAELTEKMQLKTRIDRGGFVDYG